MARRLVIKEVKQRIKDNRAIMRRSKGAVTHALVAATRGETINAVEARRDLADFIKASKAFNIDTAKIYSTD